MVYGTYSRGYKPRAFNTAATLTSDAALRNPSHSPTPVPRTISLSITNAISARKALPYQRPIAAASSRPHRPWVALPIMEPTDAFTMRVLFPPDSTWAEYEFLAYERVGQAYDKPYTDKADVLFADDRSWIQWRVEHPNLNWVYKIVWKWTHR